MQEEKNLPTVDEFCKTQKKSGKTKTSDQIRQSMTTSRLLNPLLGASLPKEMDEKLTVYRTPIISQCIIFDSIKDFFDNKEACEMNLKNIHTKGYFEKVALEYLKTIPSNAFYYDAKDNISKNIEKVEQYPLLNKLLINTNPVETIRIGLDLISSKVALRYQITVSDVISQLDVISQFDGGDTDA